MIIGFTGSRPQKIGGFSLPNPTYNSICQQTEELLLKLKPDKCISGMAQGYDSYAANICIKLKIPFIAAIPHVGQENIWPLQSQTIYKKMLTKAESIVIVSEGGYAAYKMQVRNQYIVDNCDLLIAAYDGTPGGTHNCVQYAEKVNREIIRIKI